MDRASSRVRPRRMFGSMVVANLVRSLGLLTLVSAFALPTVGCKKPDKRRGTRTVKATIAEFDPASMTVDLDKYGSERVDDWEVQQAFNRSFDGLDQCVFAAKEKAGMKPEDTLDGDVDFAERRTEVVTASRRAGQHHVLRGPHRVDSGASHATLRPVHVDPDHDTRSAGSCRANARSRSRSINAE